jgi:hypothetical protein
MSYSVRGFCVKLPLNYLTYIIIDNGNLNARK